MANIFTVIRWHCPACLDWIRVPDGSKEAVSAVVRKHILVHEKVAVRRALAGESKKFTEEDKKWMQQMKISTEGL